MAAELRPIRLGVTAGDFYTLWAPRWRDGGDEWEGFLGLDEDVFAFTSVADLTAFVRSGTANDLTDHPAWDKLVTANAHKLEPAEDSTADLIAVHELLAEKPTEDALTALAVTLSVVSSIGSVCELPTVMRFFNGNPNLGLIAGGIDQFTGRAGRKRWDIIGDIVARGWDGVVSAVDEVITTPTVDAAASARAAAELDEPWDDLEENDDIESATEPDADRAEVTRAAADTVVLGSDADFWEQVGIDPVRVMTGGGTFYTLRCYFDERPIFLGRNGRISVFPSERAMARYLADEHDHDLSGLSTYDDIRTAATDGSLRIDITEDNIYVLNGLADDIADGPDALDRDQLALAVEFIRDVGTYSEDDTIATLLAVETPIGRLVGHILDPESTSRPGPPYSAAVKQWEQLETFVESRLRSE
ncbi:MAG: primosomal protein [Mycobacterium sp.]|nr:primosomal protein [Mycobacterium sp.]